MVNKTDKCGFDRIMLIESIFFFNLPSGYISETLQSMKDGISKEELINFLRSSERARVSGQFESLNGQLKNVNMS